MAYNIKNREEAEKKARDKTDAMMEITASKTFFANLRKDLMKEKVEERKRNQRIYMDSMIYEKERIEACCRYYITETKHNGDRRLFTDILLNKRLNRVASLSQLVALINYSCLPEDAAKAWKKLDTSQQEEIDAVFKKIIDEFDSIQLKKGRKIS